MKGETRTVVNIIPASAAALEERAIRFRFRFRFRRCESERSARGSSSSSSADGCALLVFVEDVNASRSNDGVFLIVFTQNAGGAKIVAGARQRARVGRGDRHHLRLSSQKQARAL